MLVQPTPAQNASRKRVVALILAAIAAGGATGGLDKLLNREEGNRTTAYRDMGGRWTICRGVTHAVKPGEHRTEQQCQDINSAEARSFLAKVDAGFIKRQPDTRRVAFTDFAYNVGITAFLQSKARRLINRDEIAKGCAELPKWVYVSGHVVAWQVERRWIEHDLCMHGVSP